MGVEETQDLTDLGIEVGDLGEVRGEQLPCAARVREDRRQDELARRIGGGVALVPRSMRFVGGRDEEEGSALLDALTEESIDRRSKIGWNFKCVSSFFDIFQSPARLRF